MPTERPRRKNAAPVVILGDGLDPHVLAVEERLEARGVPVVLVPPETLLPSAMRPVVVDKALRVEGLPTPRAVWTWRLPPPLIQPGPDFSVYARHHLAVALVLRATDEGTRVINPLEVGHGGQNKPWQLHRLARAGLPVPRTHVCLSRVDVVNAVAALGDSVIKPLAAGALAVRVTSEKRVPEVPLPCLVQTFAPGLDVRVTVVDGVVVSCAGIPVASGVADYRGTAEYRTGRQNYERVALGAAQQRAVLKAVRTLGLVFAGVDVRLDGKRMVILEANPAPAFLDIQDKLGDDVAGALVDALLRSRRPAPGRRNSFRHR